MCIGVYVMWVSGSVMCIGGSIEEGVGGGRVWSVVDWVESDDCSSDGFGSEGDILDTAEEKQGERLKCQIWLYINCMHNQRWYWPL